MSYGWLTESTLIPKPGKQIENVSAASLAGLRAITLQKQEDIKKHQKETGKSTNKPTKKFRTRMDLYADGTNAGVDIRNKRDECALADSIQSYEKSKKRLKEKCELYGSSDIKDKGFCQILMIVWLDPDSLKLDDTLRPHPESLKYDLIKKYVCRTKQNKVTKKNLRERLDKLKAKKKDGKVS